jgi:hypothetical protein
LIPAGTDGSFTPGYDREKTYQYREMMPEKFDVNVMNIHE